MRRAALCLSLAFILCTFFTSLASAAEVQVSIIGGENLTSLAPGIKQTITARCIAKGLDDQDYSKLSISILQMGEALSFDAILQTAPPRAFHADLKDISGITATIDTMIATLFSETPVIRQQEQTEPAASRQPKQTHEDIRLPFIATSLIVQDGSVYVSDKKTIYILKEAKAEPWWNSPGNDAIFRIYSHKDSIIALVRRGDVFNTYEIQGGTALQHWNNAVIPIGNSLVSSQITSDIDMPGGMNTWKHPSIVDGDLLRLPEDLDIPTVTFGDIMPSRQGPEIISFDRSNLLTIKTGDKTMWSCETSMNTLPLFVEQDVSTEDPPARYYMRPRIIVRDGEIITIQNDRGMSKIFMNIINYTGSDILAFSPEKSGSQERTLTHIQKYYCADIALRDTTLIALIIKKKQSSVRFIDL